MTEREQLLTQRNLLLLQRENAMLRDELAKIRLTQVEQQIMSMDAEGANAEPDTDTNRETG